MAQMDMRPEEVQHYATNVIENVRSLDEILGRLETSLKALDDIWVSNEKTVVTTAAKADIAKLKTILASFITYGTTALNIANRRVERENSYTNMMG